MASEVLSATVDPIANSGVTLFGAASLLPHTARTLSADLSGTVYAAKFGGRMQRDSVLVEYTTDAGVNWVTWFTQEATNGLEDVSHGLTAASVDANVPIASIEVRLVTGDFWPETSCTLHNIKLTCDNTPIPAGTYYSLCSAFV